MTVTARPQKRDRSTTILLLLAALIAIGGIAFAVGRLTAPSAAAATNNNGNGGFRNGFGRNFPSLAPGQTFNPAQLGQVGQFVGRNGIEGTVTAVDANSLTLKLTNGLTVTFSTNNATTYHQETAAASSDVKPGATVRVSVQGGGGAGGLGGGQNNPGSSPAPGASPETRTATDVVVVTP